MASVQSVAKFTANNAVTMYDHDPNSTSATFVGWADLRDYESFLVAAFASALTGNGVTAFSIYAAPAASDTNAQLIVSHAVGSAPDAVGDYLVLECTAEQIATVAASSGYALRYVSAKLTLQNAADENVVVYIRSGAKFPHASLTANVVA